MRNSFSCHDVFIEEVPTCTRASHRIAHSLECMNKLTEYIFQIKESDAKIGKDITTLLCFYMYHYNTTLIWNGVAFFTPWVKHIEVAQNDPHYEGDFFKWIFLKFLVWIFISLKCVPNMMMAWHGNTFRAAGPLWGEPTKHRWIAFTNDQWRRLWCFPLCQPKQTIVQNSIWRWFIHHDAHCDVSIINGLIGI